MEKDINEIEKNSEAENPSETAINVKLSLRVETIILLISLFQLLLTFFTLFLGGFDITILFKFILSSFGVLIYCCSNRTARLIIAIFWIIVTALDIVAIFRLSFGILATFPLILAIFLELCLIYCYYTLYFF